MYRLYATSVIDTYVICTLRMAEMRGIYGGVLRRPEAGDVAIGWDTRELDHAQGARRGWNRNGNRASYASALKWR
jgi:hypothetical protein